MTQPHFPSSKHPRKFMEDAEREELELPAQKSRSSSININLEDHESPGHPYDKYVANEDYALVYSRNRDLMETLTPNSDDFSGT
jgi:hypothetical protein